MAMNANVIREKFLSYMKERGHVEIPSAALVPENDPTTLFTGSGMQPLIPYLMGETHPKGVRLTDSQKCFRAADIEEVGDNRHTTFFEMLGNWSLGDYFKSEQLLWFYNFLVEEVGLDPERLYVTVFQGDKKHNVPRDNDSVQIWQNLFKEKGVSYGVGEMGSEQAGGERGMKEGERIFFYDSAKNWWSRSGKPEEMPAGEIGGPDSEVFYDFGAVHDPKFGPHCHPNCDCGRFMEIGNSVFIEYKKTEGGTFEKLPKQNVDFGGGLERIAAARAHNSDVFTIEELVRVVREIEKVSGSIYEDKMRAFRIVVDHIRGATFMIGDGVLPGNSEQKYFVRRLLRRAVHFADTIGVPEGNLSKFADIVIEQYKGQYSMLIEQREKIIDAIQKEEAQFRSTLKKGMKRFEKNIETGTITGEDVFELCTTYGFPYELAEELAKERGVVLDKEDFARRMKEHQELSRAGSVQKFKGGLADSSDMTVAYHTVTHVLLAALRKVLGAHVHQAGANITGERLRLDFTHGEKLTDEEKSAIETYVNDVLKTGARVTTELVQKSHAEQDPTIEGSFWERYPDEVKVYTIIDENSGTVYSRELCGGPHVTSLKEVNGEFKIAKEESSSLGVRRIKGVLIS